MCGSLPNPINLKTCLLEVWGGQESVGKKSLPSLEKFRNYFQTQAVELLRPNRDALCKLEVAER